MSEYKLSRICSEFDKGTFKLHQFGYDENNKFSKKTFVGFKDYFFYSKENLADLTKYDRFKVEEGKVYKALNDEEVCRVFYRSIKDKKELNRSHPDRIFEEDVSPEFKFICDENLEFSKVRHILFFDIETWYDKDDDSANSPDKTIMPITSIVGYSTKDEEYVVFSWHPEKTKDFEDLKTVDKDGIKYVFSKTEDEMLLAFFSYVSMNNVDILSGWYSAQFDLPYIINRCKTIGIDYKVLSPIGKVRIYKQKEYWKVFIEGLDHIDMMDALKDLNFNLSNWKLATAAEEILEGSNIEKLTDTTWKDWLDNYKGFLDYAIRDVEILFEISKKLNVFELYANLQNIAKLPALNQVFFKSMIVDNYILNSFHNKLIFPTRRTKKRQAYVGAIVLDPKEPGSHKDIAILDYSSLYPTTIMAFNISPETFIASEASAKEAGLSVDEIIKSLEKEGIEYIDTGFNKELFGKRYLFFGHSYRLGVLPFLLKKLLLDRREINKNIANEVYTKDEAYAAHREQIAIKLILNSAYGAMGFNYFRLYTPECADSITYFAREALKFAAVKLHTELGHPVIYGDTDSCFVKESGKTKIEMKDMLAEFNKMLKSDFVTKYVSKVNDEYFLMDLEFEKDLEYAYFGDSKKRYYGIERISGEKYIKGLNIIRKDAPKFIKKQLDTLAEHSVKNKIRVNHLIALRKNIESVPYSELGITKAFGKPFWFYKKNKPQHLKAALWANDILNTKITHSDNPLLFYVTSTCQDELKPRDRNNAICVKEEDLDMIDKSKALFKMDYDMFFEKQVLDQLDEFKYIPAVEEALKDYEKTTTVL
tara:strand:- start:343 stop:2796 length:2454 start_codon:yes stop_codon:yes gene_type:complete